MLFPFHKYKLILVFIFASDFWVFFWDAEIEWWLHFCSWTIKMKTLWRYVITGILQFALRKLFLFFWNTWIWKNVIKNFIFVINHYVLWGRDGHRHFYAILISLRRRALYKCVAKYSIFKAKIYLLQNDSL